MHPHHGPSSEEMHQASLAEARRKRELAEEAWPKAWREQIEADQRRHDANVLALKASIESLGKAHREALEIQRIAINQAGAHIANLTRQLSVERSARERLEATPRQTINLSMPERETKVQLDVTPPAVNVTVPPRRKQTEVERDKAGRITRTTSTEVDDLRETATS